MSRKKKKLPILKNIRIESVAAEGKCIAHVDDFVIFVPFVVPGDIVDLQICKKRKNYCEATVIRFLTFSPIRTKPKCEHFGICGGCKWQNLPYSEQLKAKQQQVTEQLIRIGKIKLPEISQIMGSQQIFEYRNKLEFGCANKRWYTKEELEKIPENKGLTEGAIGFHITGAFDKIYPIKHCHLMDNYCNNIRNFIYDYALNNNISFYNTRGQKGLLRSLMIRNSNSGEWMLLVQFHYDENSDKDKALKLMDSIANNFPKITSLLYVNNQKGNDTFNDLELNIFKGSNYILEKMENLRFKVGPKSFYQTNTEQAYHLYSVARNFANLTGHELVYDLYTGTGTIANFIAKKARKVIGVEYVPEAIEDAKVNSRINNINNTTFYAGDMKDILTEEFIKQHGTPDVIITDPPRAGMHSDVINVIIKAQPKRIVYVSCNPATQARDLSLLDSNYRVMAVQPVDMFPHTPHVENVVMLENRVNY